MAARDEQEGYGGQDRRNDEPTRLRFNQAVEEAARRAAQQVAQIHRRRLVVQSFLAALIAASAIAMVAVLVVRSSNNAFARRNAIYDCTLFERAAGVLGDFVQSDANLRLAQVRLGLNGTVAHDLSALMGHSALGHAARVSSSDSLRAVDLWRQDARSLRDLAGVDCPSHLGG